MVLMPAGHRMSFASSSRLSPLVSHPRSIMTCRGTSARFESNGHLLRARNSRFPANRLTLIAKCIVQRCSLAGAFALFVVAQVRQRDNPKNFIAPYQRRLEISLSGADGAALHRLGRYTANDAANGGTALH